MECLGCDVASELVAAFWQDLPGALGELVGGLESGDGDETADRVLHTLKGSAGSLGYAGVAGAAQAVRTAMRAGVEAGPALAGLRAMLRQARRGDPDIAGSVPDWDRLPA